MAHTNNRLEQRLREHLDAASSALGCAALRKIARLDLASVSCRDILAEQSTSLVVHCRRDALRFDGPLAPPAAPPTAGSGVIPSEKRRDTGGSGAVEDPDETTIDPALFAPVVPVPSSEAAAVKLLWLPTSSSSLVNADDDETVAAISPATPATEGGEERTLRGVVNEVAALVRVCAHIAAVAPHLSDHLPAPLAVGAGTVKALQRQGGGADLGSASGRPTEDQDAVEAPPTRVVEVDRRAVCIAMTFCRGAAMHRLFADGSRGLRRPFLQLVGLQLAAILRAIHSAGVVYRDVKLPNVLVNADGKVFLVDFGSAYIHAGASGAGEDEDWSHKSAMPVTAQVRPPQDRQRGRAPFASDAYAFGNFMFEAGYASPAFGGFGGTNEERSLTFPAPPPVSRSEAVAMGGDRLHAQETALKDLITTLLDTDGAKRLGCCGGGGGLVDWAAIVEHPFFAEAQREHGQGSWANLLEAAFEASGPHAEEIDMQLLGL